MNASTRYTIALHVLTLLATSDGEPLTSEYIAGSVNTNPVVIRRVLRNLRIGGLVSSTPGNQGGWRLRRPAGDVTLAEVRSLMEEGSPFGMHSQPPNPACPVGRAIQGVLSGVYDNAERALERELGRTTIADLLAGVSAK